MVSLNRYRVLYLTTNWSSGVTAIGINRNDTTGISFCAAFDNGASYVEMFYFTKNSNTGTTLKYVCGSYHNVAGAGEADTLQVTGIWGLI